MLFVGQAHGLNHCQRIGSGAVLGTRAENRSGCLHKRQRRLLQTRRIIVLVFGTEAIRDERRSISTVKRINCDAAAELHGSGDIMKGQNHVKRKRVVEWAEWWLA